MNKEIKAAIIIKEKWPYGESVSPIYKDAAYDCTLKAIEEMVANAMDFVSEHFYNHPHSTRLVCSDDFISVSDMMEKLEQAMIGG